MAISIGSRFGATSASGWNDIQNWRTRQQAGADAIAFGASISDLMSNAAANRAQGAATLAAQAALKRIGNAYKVKTAKAADQLSKANIVWTKPKTTSVTLPDGTLIDLVNNTMTLADGTVFDTKTGLKVDVTA